MIEKELNIIEKWAEDNKDNPDRVWDVGHIYINKDYFSCIISSGRSHHICTSCGYPQFDNTLSYNKLKEDQKCQHCDYWDTIMKAPNKIIVGKRYYHDNGYRKGSGSMFLGFGGREFKYKMNGSEEVITTNNMWNGSEIPSTHYQGDNAVFL